MDLPIALTPAGAALPTYVVLSAPAGTTFAQARPLLARACGAGDAAQWHIDGDPIDGELLVGAEPLLEGAGLTWSPAPASSAPGSPTRRGNGRPQPGGIEIRVVSGPDAGLRHPLPPGRHLLGRGGSAEVRLTDEGASRRHATVHVGRDRVTVADLGSSNGTRVDGAPIGSAEVPVEVGSFLTVGATTLMMASPTHGEWDRATTARGDGTLALNRSPRIDAHPEATVVHLPAPPQRGDPPRYSLPMLLLPLVVSGLAALLLRSPIYLAFGLLGPAMSTAQFTTDRRRHRDQNDADAAAYADALHRTAGRVAWLTDAERHGRRASCPDPAELAAACSARSVAVWRRSPGDHDWLELSLGLGRVPARLTVRDHDGVEHHPPLDRTPVTVRLAKAGVLGISGGYRASEVARCLLTQVLAWHGPRHVRLWVLADAPTELGSWAWLGWAPHVRTAEGPRWAQAGALGGEPDAAVTVAELTAVLERRLVDAAHLGGSLAGSARAAGGRTSEHFEVTHVVLLAGVRALRDQPGVARLLTLGPTVGFVFIAIATKAEDLPSECTAVLTVERTLARLAERAGLVAVAVAVDACSLPRAEMIARGLAPLRDATPGGEQEIPQVVHLSDVEADPFDTDAVTARWARQPADTTFALGIGRGGVVELDLSRDGPHALVGGTTGAGKSELLRALIAALALRNRPDRMTFVLVDYKGGSAFDACARLPHVTGLVTDLDGDATRRALAGLEAELKAREARLRTAGAADLRSYTALVDAGACDDTGSPLSHLARLVVVVDEYRALAEEIPDFVAGLVRLAALGRSLGLHLVLATQRPAGIVSGDMRANIALRIALRVRDAADSLDVVETDAAAAISSRRPGRAVVRGAGAEPLPLQTTYLGAGVDAEACPLEVRALLPELIGASLDGLPLLASAASTRGRDAGGGESHRIESDLSRVARALSEAAHRLHATAPPPPWLPPLPLQTTLDEIATLDQRRPSPVPVAARRCRAAGAPTLAPPAPVLLVDDPARQRRFVQSWDPRTGHLGVIGRSGSGRTALLRTLIAAAAAANCPQDLSMYVVDATGDLGGVADFPHVGAYLRLDEEGALRRLVAGLLEASRGGRPDGAHRLLVIDGWEQTRGVLERLDHGTCAEDLVQAARAGTAAGLTLLASGERSLLTGPLAALLAERMVLDLTDATDAYLAGLDVGAGRRPPGRVRLSSGLDAQAALLAVHPMAIDELDVRGRCAELEDEALRLQALAAGAVHLGCPGPAWRVGSLPTYVDLADVPTGAGFADHTVPFGIDEGGAAATLTLDGRGVLIAGPRGSGRTTTLDTLESGLLAAGRFVARCEGRPRGPILTPTPAAGPRFGTGDTDALRRLLADHPAAVALVDDVEALAGTPMEEVLRAHAEAGTAGSVVAAGLMGDLVASYRGLVGSLRRSSYGVLLAPGPRSAEVFGLPLPGGEPPLPGRGVVVDDQWTRVVQVACQRRLESTTPAIPAAAIAPTARPSHTCPA